MYVFTLLLISTTVNLMVDSANVSAQLKQFKIASCGNIYFKIQVQYLHMSVF